MKFTLQREALLKPLQLVVGAVDKKQSLSVLGNLLIQVQTHQLILTGTDSEIELQTRVALVEPAIPGVTTAPARKIVDIVRNLPEASMISFTLDNERLTIKSGRSRFTLSTLPADEFPSFEEAAAEHELVIPQKLLHGLLARSAFSMAQQDVRHYLNGLCLSLHKNSLSAVATDGHRLAYAESACAWAGKWLKLIVPRKAINEWMRLLDANEEMLTVSLDESIIRLHNKAFTFSSKLIEGRFPDHKRVIPTQPTRVITLDRDVLKQSLNRASILSNEKYHGVSVQLKPQLLTFYANNPEQEQAEEEIEIEYSGEPLDIGFNVSYLLDVLSHIAPGMINLSFTDANSSVLIEHADSSNNCAYVVMPMRL